MEEKYFKIRGQYVSYNDAPIELTPRNHVVEGALSFVRGACRVVWFIVASFALSLLFALFVQPAKLAALLKVHWTDMREMK